MKLAVIVGHREHAGGAYSPTFGEAEYSWNKDLAQRILDVKSKVERRVFYRDGQGISGAYAAADKWGADLATELHFNSAHKQTATGTGILYYPGSVKGRSFAKQLFLKINAVLALGDWPRRSGGIVTPYQASGKQQRGLGSLSAGRAPATLLEPFFGSNPNDCRVATKRKDDYAAAIVAAADALR
ncbi:MAG: N-acetylmuramoyl-L-alanine amidase [Halocynthiibacter sp.]